MGRVGNRQTILNKLKKGDDFIDTDLSEELRNDIDLFYKIIENDTTNTGQNLFEQINSKIEIETYKNLILTALEKNINNFEYFPKEKSYYFSDEKSNIIENLNNDTTFLDVAMSKNPLIYPLLNEKNKKNEEYVKKALNFDFSMIYFMSNDVKIDKEFLREKIEEKHKKVIENKNQTESDLIKLLENKLDYDDRKKYHHSFYKDEVAKNGINLVLKHLKEDINIIKKVIEIKPDNYLCLDNELAKNKEIKNTFISKEKFFYFETSYLINKKLGDNSFLGNKEDFFKILSKTQDKMPMLKFGIFELNLIKDIKEIKDELAKSIPEIITYDKNEIKYIFGENYNEMKQDFIDIKNDRDFVIEAYKNIIRNEARENVFVNLNNNLKVDDEIIKLTVLDKKNWQNFNKLLEKVPDMSFLKEKYPNEVNEKNKNEYINKIYSNILDIVEENNIKLDYIFFGIIDNFHFNIKNLNKELLEKIYDNNFETFLVKYNKISSAYSLEEWKEKCKDIYYKYNDEEKFSYAHAKEMFEYHKDIREEKIEALRTLIKDTEYEKNFSFFDINPNEKNSLFDYFERKNSSNIEIAELFIKSGAETRNFSYTISMSLDDIKRDKKPEISYKFYTSSCKEPLLKVEETFELEKELLGREKQIIEKYISEKGNTFELEKYRDKFEFKLEKNKEKIEREETVEQEKEKSKDKEFFI